MTDLSKIKIGSTTHEFKDNVSTFGGTNLLTKDQISPSKWTHSYPNSTTFIGDGYENLWTMVQTSSWEQCYLAIPVIENQQYTLSLSYKIDKAYNKYSGDIRGVSFQILSSVPPNSNAKNVELSYIEFPNTVSSTYERKYTTFTPNTTTVYFNINGGYMADGSSSANTPIHINYIKLEKGNKPTDWTPAPEDLVKVSGTELQFFQ